MLRLYYLLYTENGGWRKELRAHFFMALVLVNGLLSCFPATAPYESGRGILPRTAGCPVIISNLYSDFANGTRIMPTAMQTYSYFDVEIILPYI